MSYLYIMSFVETLEVRVPGHAHGFATPDLQVQPLHYWPQALPHHPSKFTPPVLGWWHAIDPVTYDVQVHFSINKYPGLVAIWPSALASRLCYHDWPRDLFDHFDSAQAWEAMRRAYTTAC